MACRHGQHSPGCRTADHSTPPQTAGTPSSSPQDRETSMDRRISNGRTQQWRAFLVLGAVTCSSILGAPYFSHADPEPDGPEIGNDAQPAGDENDLVVVRGTITR